MKLTSVSRTTHAFVELGAPESLPVAELSEPLAELVEVVRIGPGRVRRRGPVQGDPGFRRGGPELAGVMVVSGQATRLFGSLSMPALGGERIDLVHWHDSPELLIIYPRLLPDWLGLT